MNDKVILVVDDEIDLLEMIQSIFERAGFFNILTASSGTEALKIWKERQPDMIILDIMMPGIDGLSVLREVRETSNIPVLLLTARGEAEDRVAGLEVGADDYLVKPFHPKELLLRVQVILNRTYPQKERKIYLEAAVVDLEKADVQRGENQFPLTGKELTLLEKLAENAGRIVTTGSLCGAVCGEFWQGYESTLSTHIRHLREKIEENPSLEKPFIEYLEEINQKIWLELVDNYYIYHKEFNEGEFVHVLDQNLLNAYITNITSLKENGDDMNKYSEDDMNECLKALIYYSPKKEIDKIDQGFTNLKENEKLANLLLKVEKLKKLYKINKKTNGSRN